MNSLELQNISVAADGTEIVHDISLVIPQGRIIALMGPNGSGKSSLVNAVMGHPRYAITSGNVFLGGEDITHIPPHEKAKKGIFLSLQNPPTLIGVSVSSFLRNAYSALVGRTIPVFEFQKLLLQEMERLSIGKEMAERNVNEGFSGGEKIRLEALQLALFRPKFALLDETDSGLDVDALKTVAEIIKAFAPNMGILLITHYTRILRYIVPDEVHIMQDGAITRSGGKELAEEIEEKGYKI